MFVFCFKIKSEILKKVARCWEKQTISNSNLDCDIAWISYIINIGFNNTFYCSSHSFN